jgi:hypothetical protein
LTDALDFEGGVTKDGEPPASSSGADAPQLTEVDGNPLRLGAAFSYALSSDFVRAEDVTGAVVAVSGASRYIEVTGSLQDGVLDLVGRLAVDTGLAGKTFSLRFALRNAAGLTGLYREIEVVVSEATAQSEPQGGDLMALSLSGGTEEISNRPVPHAGEDYPQIQRIVAPAAVRPGATVEVELQTSFAGAIRQAALSTPGSDKARLIDLPGDNPQGVVTLNVKLVVDASDGDQYVFLWALVGENGAGLYRPWFVTVDEESPIADGDHDADATEGDNTVDGDMDDDRDPDVDPDVEAEADGGEADEVGEGELAETEELEMDGSDATDGDADDDLDAEGNEGDLEVEADLESPYPVWEYSYGDVGTNQFGRDVAAGPSGMTYLIGDYYGSVTVGDTVHTSVGLGDILLVKLDADGEPLWSKSFGDISRQDGQTVAVDSDGNVIVAGHFAGTVEFGLAGADALTSQGFTDIYLAKFDTDGNHLWSQRYGDSNWQYASDVVVDAAGNIYLVGDFEGSVDFGGDILTAVGSQSDIYLVKFNSAGDHQWSQRFGDALDQFGVAVDVDGLGAVYLTGDFYGTLNFGGDDLTSVTETDVYLAKFEAAGGAHLWSDSFGDAAIQSAGDIAVTPGGDIWLVGSNYGTMRFEHDLVSQGAADVFLAQLSSSGIPLWSTGVGDEDSQIGRQVSINSDGHICIAGSFNGTVNFGGSDYTRPDGSAIFVAMYTGPGEHSWSQGYGFFGNNHAFGLALGEGKRVIMTGIFDSLLTFDSSHSLNSAGGNDIWVAAFGYQ